MKFILKNNITKFLLVLCFLTSTLSLNIKRVSNKKALPENFDAILTITNHSKKTAPEKVEISLNKASLKDVSSGIQVTLLDTKKKIESPAFLSSGNGVYFVPFRSFVSSIECTSSSWIYYKNGLTFFVNNNNDSISFSLGFPKKYFNLLGNTIDDKDAAELCKSISSNISKYVTKAKEIKSIITKNLNNAIALEKERAANIKSKQDMEKYLKEQEALKADLLAKRKKIEEDKAAVDTEIVNIEASKTLKLKQSQNYENDMQGLDDNLLLLEKSVTENSKATTFKEIPESQVNELYEKVKAEINNLVKLHSDKDPAVVNFKTFASNVKANKDKIIESFKN
jgi:hypothetical protein